MDYNFHVYFSNRLEELYQNLKETLYASPTTPFTKRLVIVPGSAIKSWLSLKLAQDPAMGIAAGIEFVLLDQAIPIIKEAFGTPFKGKFPQLAELSLVIQAEIKKIVSLIDYTENEEKWRPLLDYLGLDFSHCSFSLKSERRLLTLADQLAKNFQQYGSYGGAWLKEWELQTKKEKPKSAKHWQFHLWEQLFQSSTSWSYLYRELRERNSLIKTPNLAIHLFSISFLSTLLFDFFKECATKIRVNQYLLSPCQYFWSDMRSDKESAYFLRKLIDKGISLNQQRELENYLRECNPLLANYGRLGREMVIKIEESLAETHESYILPSCLKEEPLYSEYLHPDTEWEETAAPLTLLQAIQADMQLLRTPKKEQLLCFETYDETVAIHAAPTHLREVQAIYDALLKIIDRHKEEEEPLYPQDIVVMAPAILDYESSIKMVFLSATSQLDAQIMDLHQASQNKIIQGFLQLLELVDSRWEMSALLDLFQHPAFQAKQKIKPLESQVIEKWIRDCKMTWGYSSTHRDTILKQQHCTKGMVDGQQSGTWQEGVERLLDGLIYAPIDETLQLEAPYEGLDLTERVLFGKIIHLVHHLYQETRSIQQENLTLAHWSQRLKKLFQTYFDQESEGEEAHALIKIFEGLQTMHQQLEAALFNFNSIFKYIKDSLAYGTATFRENHVSAIRFCSLLPLRTLPAKVVVLMGMQEGAYPRQALSSSLDLLNNNPQADYYPSTIDFDRYLFIEALLSARRYFLMSYLNRGEKDYKLQAPSLVVSELINYMDRSYQLAQGNLSAACMIHHPYNAFDKSCFTSQSPTRSFSQENYRNAKAFYQTTKVPAHAFISSFDLILPSQQLDKEHFKLKELASFAVNPLKIYFNRSLGIYLENKEKQEIKKQECYQLTALDHDFIKKRALKNPLDFILKCAEKQGKLPCGLFKEIAIDRLQEDIEDLRKNYIKVGIEASDSVEVEFSNLYEKVHCTPNGKWQVPALKIQDRNKKWLKLEGKLVDVSSQGLIFYRSVKKEDIAKILPTYLIFHCLVKAHQLPFKPHVIFLKDGKIRPSFTDKPEEYLEKYLTFYLLALENGTPLIPEWLPSLLFKGEKNQNSSAQAFSGEYTSSYNDYLNWLMRHSPDSSSKVSRPWQEIAENLFAEIYSCWVPSQKEEET